MATRQQMPTPQVAQLQHRIRTLEDGLRTITQYANAAVVDLDNVCNSQDKGMVQHARNLIPRMWTEIKFAEELLQDGVNTDSGSDEDGEENG